MKFTHFIIRLALLMLLITQPPLSAQNTRIAKSSFGQSLVEAARAQIGVTVTYDPAYVRIPYPRGDVPMDRGVCTDVVIRAWRTAWNQDLQQLVHEDMRRHFHLYPKNWKLPKPDPHIDHRRVLNLRVYFQRHHQSFPPSQQASAYAPGDLVTNTLPGNLPHIMIVSDRKTSDGTPLVIHNMGRGAREEDMLFRFPLTGHYRARLNSSSTTTVSSGHRSR